MHFTNKKKMYMIGLFVFFSCLLIFSQLILGAIETMEGDRAVLFIIGPQRDSYDDIIDLSFLRKHFDKADIIRTTESNWISKIGKFGNFNVVLVFVAVHGTQRKADEESYVNCSADIEKNIHDFSKWVTKKDFPFQGLMKTKQFHNTVREELSQVKHIMFFLEICALKLKTAADLPPGTLDRPYQTLVVPMGEPGENNTIITHTVPTDQPLIENFQDAIKTSPGHLVQTNDLGRILKVKYDEDITIKGDKTGRKFINPRVLKIIRRTGGVPEVLKIINLTERFKNAYTIDFGINNTQFKLEKDGGKEIYTLISKQGKSKTIDMQDRTVASVDINEMIKCRLTIESQYSNLVKPSPGDHYVPCGENMKVEAFKSNDIELDHWEGVDSSERTRNPIFVKVDYDKTIKAVFKQKGHQETTFRILSLNPANGGTIIAQGYGSFNSPQKLNLTSGTTITLEARPNTDWKFQRWEGDYVSSNQKITIKIEKNMEIKVVFQKGESPEGPTEFTVKKEYKKMKIQRGSSDKENQLSNYLYYFGTNSLYRIDTTLGSTFGSAITTDQLQDTELNFNTYIYPDEDGTGNRYIAFYKDEARNDTFKVYDKLNDLLDIYSFQPPDRTKKRIEIIYPVDYPAGGNYVYGVFIVVTSYMDNEGYRKYSIIQYCKSTEYELVREELVSGIISYYYNPYEKRFAWLKDMSGSNCGIQTHDLKDGKTTDMRMISCQTGEKEILFMAYDYLVIGYTDITNRTKTSEILRIKRDKISPVQKFQHSDFFSQSLRHDELEFHLLISGKQTGSNKVSLHHKEFNLEVEEELLDRDLPGQVIEAIETGRGDIKAVMFMVHVNTYYICIVKQTGETGQGGYSLTIYKLLDNFGEIIGSPNVPNIPWLKNCDEDLNFRVEENVILIQSTTTGGNLGIVYIKQAGEIDYKPD